MLILTPEQVKSCFIKSSKTHPCLGIKYENWYFYFENFVKLELAEIKGKYQQWLENTDKPQELHALLQEDNGFYFCVYLPELKAIEPDEAIAAICQTMRNSERVKISSRRQQLRVFKKCFVGSEAVTWMVKNLHISRAKAVKLGRICIEKELFAHVLAECDFEDDENKFYRFREDGGPDKKYKSFVLTK